jgi:hypothetical protein
VDDVVAVMFFILCGLLAFAIGATYADVSHIMTASNATNTTGNWSHYDGQNTFIHCDCGPDGYRDMIMYGNVTAIEGWCRMVLVSERTAT